MQFYAFKYVIYTDFIMKSEIYYIIFTFIRNSQPEKHGIIALGFNRPVFRNTVLI